jgi:hypothetical protein
VTKVTIRKDASLTRLITSIISALLVAGVLAAAAISATKDDQPPPATTTTTSTAPGTPTTTTQPTSTTPARPGRPPTYVGTGFIVRVGYGPLHKNHTSYYDRMIGARVSLSRGGRVEAAATINATGRAVIHVKPGGKGYLITVHGRAGGRVQTFTSHLQPAIRGVMMPFDLYICAPGNFGC